jgi:hypothetical protein
MFRCCDVHPCLNRPATLPHAGRRPAAHGRPERAAIRQEARRGAARLAYLQALPTFTAAEMCSECPWPMAWHATGVTFCLQTSAILAEPCRSWPAWNAKIAAGAIRVAEMLTRKERKTRPPTRHPPCGASPSSPRDPPSRTSSPGSPESSMSTPEPRSGPGSTAPGRSGPDQTPTRQQGPQPDPGPDLDAQRVLFGSAFGGVDAADAEVA